MIFNYKKIKEKNLTYIIAEIGANHDCSIKKAKKMIYLAKKGGASAAKFQTYKSEMISSKNSPAYWDTKKEKTKSQYLLFKKFDKFEKEDYFSLAKYCKKVNIDFLSTPFDTNSVDFLKKLVPAFKISSSDITNLQLLKKIGATKKPVILSTGAANIEEIKFAVNYLKKYGSKKIILLHCILNYPAKDENANLLMIKHLKKSFPNQIIGYSDHTLPSKDMINLTTAYLFGANVIEKHFTLNKKLKGNDHYHSMDFDDLFTFTKNLKLIKNLSGRSSEKKVLKSEMKSRKYARRSLVLKRNIKKGEFLSESNIISLRPVRGVPAEKLNFVIGKQIKKNKKAGEHLFFKDFYNLKKKK